MSKYWFDCIYHTICHFILILNSETTLLCLCISGFSAATSMFTFIVLIITIIICLSHVCFGHFKYLSAHNYKVIESLLWKLFIISKCTCMILLNMLFCHRLTPRMWMEKVGLQCVLLHLSRPLYVSTLLFFWKSFLESQQSFAKLLIKAK